MPGCLLLPLTRLGERMAPARSSSPRPPDSHEYGSHDPTSEEGLDQCLQLIDVATWSLGRRGPHSFQAGRGKAQGARLVIGHRGKDHESHGSDRVARQGWPPTLGSCPWGIKSSTPERNQKSTSTRINSDNASSAFNHLLVLLLVFVCFQQSMGSVKLANQQL